MIYLKSHLKLSNKQYELKDKNNLDKLLNQYHSKIQKTQALTYQRKEFKE